MEAGSDCVKPELRQEAEDNTQKDSKENMQLDARESDVTIDECHDNNELTDHHDNHPSPVSNTHKPQKHILADTTESEQREDTNDLNKHSLTSEQTNATMDTNKSTQNDDELTKTTQEEGQENANRASAPQSEEEKIQELMGRSDTAVIYPEPVDDEGRDNEQGPATPDHINTDNIEDGCDEVKCPHCERVLDDPILLKSHIVSAHPDQTPVFVCPRCNAQFLLKSQLEKHNLYHSPTVQICKICNKSFANVYRLQRHMICHEESNELRKFKCLECGKAFKFKHHLKEHVRIHSGEKPFQCNNCGKRFSHSGSYSSHMTSKKCWVVGPRARGRTPEGSPAKEISANSPSPARIPSTTSFMTPTSGFMSSPTASTPFLPFLPRPFPPIGGSLPYMPFSNFTGGLLNPMHPINTISPGFIQKMTAAYSLASMGVGGTQVSPIAGQLPSMQRMMSPGRANTPHTPQSPSSAQFNNPAASPRTDEGHSTDNASNVNHSTPTEKYNNQSSTENPQSSTENKQSSIDAKSKETNETSSDNNITSPSKDKPSDSADSNKENDADSDEYHKDESKNSADSYSAVKKVLETVHATVSNQQQTGEDKSAISRLGKADGQLNTKEDLVQRIHERVEEISRVNASQDQKCRHCCDTFSNPIELHQHERYLCKLNRDIYGVSDGVDSPTGAASPSVHSMDTDRSNIDTDDECSDAMEPDELDKDGRSRFRSRSMINDHQLEILKSHYKINPRPRKFELIRIGNEINFPKRVVQVWFQNMRARDRKKGKDVPYFPTMARFKNRDQPPSNTPPRATSDGKSAPYIPIVPRPFSNMSVYTSQPTPTPGVLPTYYHSPAGPVSSQEEPLDLSINKSSSSPDNTPRPSPTHSHEDTSSPLNLSIKRSSSDRPMENSNIYRYMHQEGLISPRSFNMAKLSGYPHIDNNGNLCSKMNLLQEDLQRSSTPGSSISSRCSSKDDSVLNCSFGSSISNSLIDFHMSAEANRRNRKKTWKQMEAEQMHLTDDTDDNLIVDEEGNFVPRKKRKSWKQHKIDIEEQGMYACDQCEKMFNKQSSLARHKYEHSGARPFPCDICPKAFKHKHHLVEHKRLHSGEKPFVCRKCGKRFSHSGSFSQHMNHRYKYCKPLINGNDTD
ncbi:unnamed protein product [Owenia fusiformis]|uniref:Zinc finger protein 1 n=1 Tax=Owenia fusiformis TaxID=6347 RepID=A0A8S4N103_OWEFU|nr:unnamed protein product [Owenia fusiformis]